MARIIFGITLLAVLLACGGVECGVLDLFNIKSDYNLAEALDTTFALLRNDAGLVLYGNITTPIEEDVTFWCGNRESPELRQVTLEDAKVKEKINFTKPIMFVTHGWLDDRSKNWIQDTAKDAIKFVDTNACVVGWGHLAQYNYYQAARNNTLMVSGYLTKFIKFINDTGMPLTNITLVGHSLGGQIVGQVGYNFDGQIGQIYGLDPAGPLFTFPKDRGLRYRLDKTDAVYVQMILTSRYTLGVGKGEGHENFFPNGGDSPQTNCIVPLARNAEMADHIVCSHLHACSLFQLSLNPTVVYKGRRCSNWLAYLGKTCAFNQADIIGYHSEKKEGNFFLRTSVLSPYTD